MVLAFGLAMAMANPQQQVGGAFADYLNKITPNWEGVNVDFRTTVTGLLKQLGVKYWLSPGLDGKITGSYKQSKLSNVLDGLCDQVGGGYQQVGDTLRVWDNGAWDHFDHDQNYYSFAPCTPTSTATLRSDLFVSPKQTKGGTYDLLAEAIRSAGYQSTDVMSYGENGFAIELPFESIDPDGLPFVNKHRARAGKRGRFHFKMSYLPRLGMPRLSELFASGLENEDMDYRMMVLTVTTGDGSPGKTPLKRGENGLALPQAFRDSKWEKTPTLTALVYEFRRAPGQHMASLVKPGESKILAKQHLILAGLWTDKELDK